MSVTLLVCVVGLASGVAIVGIVMALKGRGPDVIDVKPPPGAVVQGSSVFHDLLRAGQKLEAVKRYKEQTGVGLAEAKAAIDALERGEAVALPPAPAPLRVDPASDGELSAHLSAGRLLEAIKRYRELTGVGLAEAKAAVESLRDSRKS